MEKYLSEQDYPMSLQDRVIGSTASRELSSVPGLSRTGDVRRTDDDDCVSAAKRLADSEFMRTSRSGCPVDLSNRRVGVQLQQHERPATGSATLVDECKLNNGHDRNLN